MEGFTEEGWEIVVPTREASEGIGGGFGGSVRGVVIGASGGSVCGRRIVLSVKTKKEERIWVRDDYLFEWKKQVSRKVWSSSWWALLQCSWFLEDLLSHNQ